MYRIGGAAIIDALLYAVRDFVRALKIGYGIAECEVTEDGHPPPRCGNWFVAVHGGRSRPGLANRRNLHELFDFSVTLTGRVTVPLDRLGDQMIARDISLVPLAQRQGFNAKVEQLRTFLHMNWQITVLQGQTPNSANDNIIAWSSGTVYGFVLPAAYQGETLPELKGPEWFGAAPDADVYGVVCEMRFQGAERFQPQTAPVGAFT